MRNNIFYCLLGFIVFLSACAKDNDNPVIDTLDEELTAALLDASNGMGKSHFVLPQSNDFSNIPQDPKNILSPVKVTLGQLLYHDTGLGLGAKLDMGKGTFSCATCHFASAGFQAGRFQGIGDGGIGFGINGEGRVRNPEYSGDSLDVQPLRTPTSMNGAYQEAMLWNGQFGATGINAGTEDQWTEGTPIATNHKGYEGLETQAIAGLGVHRLVVDENQLCEETYAQLFNSAFPEFSEEERITAETAGLAIAAYERTLMSSQAPFQQWLKGNQTAMSEAEKRGALVFFNEGQCSSCHNGPALNAMEFHALGMNELFDISETTFGTKADDPSRLGRGSFTKNEADNYKFKVPQLYNLADSPFYGHGSSFRSIRDVIVYKNNAVAENDEVPASQLAAGFVPLNLTDTQIDDLTTFLTTALRDDNLTRFEPQILGSGFCFPNNDEQSRIDLGCD